ncbi:MAG: 30S ribosomal protein S20 [Rhodospirillales bacterium]|nr:30S ribosomal protein S20 [Rhodospirillales bacterium]
MANSPQAKKRIRQTARRTEVNRTRRSTIRTHLRKVEDAIAGGDATAAKAALQAAEPQVARGAQKGLYHKNMAARKISRLTTRVKAMAV